MTTVRAPSAPQSANPATSSLLDGAASGQSSLQKGAEGDDVKALQRALNAHGANLKVDGDFGPATQDAVRRFQRQNRLSVDGVVGPNTMAKLRELPVVQDGVERSRGSQQGELRAPTRDEQAHTPTGTVRAGDLTREEEARRNAGPVAATLAPSNMSEAEKYDHYARIVRANGGQVNPNGQPTVLGLRGLSMDGERHDSTSARRYDDTMVVLTRDQQGRPHVQEFRGATHPGQNSSRASPDVTGDGAGDVGTIRPGNYNVVANGNYKGSPSYHVRTTGGSGNVPGWRDTNHDGRFTDQERAASERRGDTLSGVLFHPGGSTAPSSIGCQTLSPTDYRDFMRAIGGSRANFNYTLVDASRG